MKIAIIDDYQDVVKTLACFELLEGHDVQILNDTEKDPALLAAKLQDVEALVLIRERTAITTDLLKQLPNLKLISQTGKIAGHLDLEACNNHKVAVAEGVGSPVAPAELAWLLIMNTLRQLPNAIAAMKAGNWQTNIGTSVYGKTIGIWGYGKIGKLIANYAKAFGAMVLVWGSEQSRANAVADGFEAAHNKADFFSEADVVTLHLRLNEQTMAIVKASDLSLMKPTAVLVNTARAELIESGALLKCLKAGRPGFAGVDVYENEPIKNANFELLTLPNVVCAPHLGYVEQNSYELYFGKAFENVVNYSKGRPTHIVNPEVLK
ncbi:D-2-hydroxyacid dehydrogenase family protein [Pedobacter sp. KR3-3]|uniref:D-2-hydroxyacid dehydrogenase family protein n=1 Tax=Pedobacter albus TaxID=3113905 RepID=A0ABU7IBN0_9SPHI|nr:D-2-hydroxyacid dehydrogenase family protein [Pedobacter sp. KR3-3]MEE1946873.1 D-2-hydroxyacid dehydrogenase family protein [Pedobacter sp. KR3-3]